MTIKFHCQFIRSAICFALFMAFAVGLVSCDSTDPGAVMFRVDGESLTPTHVVRANFTIKYWLPVIATAEGGVFVVGSPDDNLSATHIYRLTSAKKWEQFTGNLTDSNTITSVGVRPGSSEIYVRNCGYHNEDGRSDYDWVEIARITDDGRAVDVTYSYISGFSRVTLDRIGLIDCSQNNWAIEADGSLLVAGTTGLWRVANGNTELVTDYLEVVGAFREDCELRSPSLRMGPGGETLVYDIGKYFASPECRSAPIGRDSGDAFQLAGNKLDLVFELTDGGYIQDAVIGPDRAVYALTAKYGGERDDPHRYVRQLNETQDEFLRNVQTGYGEYIGSISFSPTGDMYLVYVDESGGPLTGSLKEWLLVFPTSETLVSE